MTSAGACGATTRAAVPHLICGLSRPSEVSQHPIGVDVGGHTKDEEGDPEEGARNAQRREVEAARGAVEQIVCLPDALYFILYSAT